MRVLISVTDKTGIIDFARALDELGAEIISTGGTARMIRENGVPVADVSEVTGFPEMLDGRVKTMHPMITGAILAVRGNADHMAALRAHAESFSEEVFMARFQTVLASAMEQRKLGRLGADDAA